MVAGSAERSASPAGLESVVLHSNTVIPDLRQHAGLHVVEIVAVECPSTRIVGVESDPHPCGVGHDQHGIAHGTMERPAVDRDHLERVAVQVDRWFSSTEFRKELDRRMRSTKFLKDMEGCGAIGQPYSPHDAYREFCAVFLPHLDA
jgi:hypothetical protein